MKGFTHLPEKPLVRALCRNHTKRWSMGQSWLANFLKKFSTFILKILFIYLTVPSLSWGMQVFYLCCGIQTLSFGMWDLVPWPGIEPGPPALGVKSLSHWTTREVPQLLCVCVCVSLQLCPTLCDPMDGSPPGSSVHGILQARILEWFAMPSSMSSSWSRDWTPISYVSYTGRKILYH